MPKGIYNRGLLAFETQMPNSLPLQQPGATSNSQQPETTSQRPGDFKLAAQRPSNTTSNIRTTEMTSQQPETTSNPQHSNYRTLLHLAQLVQLVGAGEGVDTLSLSIYIEQSRKI